MTDFNPSLPHNGLPELPPPAERIETTAILKRCINARVSLAELKQAAELIPNSAVLVNALPLLEAQASSEIENIVTTTDKLFEFADIAEDRADAATKEALRYRTALYEGTKMVQRGMLTTDMAIQICSTVKGMELDIRSESGTTLKSRLSGEVIYTPPVGQKLLIQKLDNWADFMQSNTEFDPLVRMAVQHYQFEAIHPFADGNGRTGRILNILFLVQQGLLDSPILYLSRYIIQNKAAYYRLLQKVTLEQDWAAWISVRSRRCRGDLHVDHRQDQVDPGTHGAYGSICSVAFAEDLLLGIRRAPLQTALLPHWKPGRRRYCKTTDGIGVSETAVRNRHTPGSEIRAREYLRTPKVH